MTLSRGRFRDLPDGQNFIPLAPNRTLVASAVAHFGLFSAALRLRSLDDRPAVEDNATVAKGYSIFDLSTSYKFSSFEIFLNMENIFNVAWNEAQFDTGSRLRGEPTDEPSQLHFTAGSPRSVRIGMAYRY
jgi:outer membrane receptor protein involved in Fe transport